MTEVKTLAVFDFAMDMYKENGRCEDVNDTIYKHYKGFLKLRPEMATQLLKMIYGKVLLELLPKLVKAGATFDAEEVLDRLADCNVDENFIHILNGVGISTDSIAEHYGGQDWKIFLKNGLSPKWIIGDSKAANSAMGFVAEYGKNGFICELLEKCPPELRINLFSKYLKTRVEKRGCPWEQNDYFSLRPLIESGVSEDELIKAIKKYGYCDMYDLFYPEDKRQTLGLTISPEDCFQEYFTDCWQRFGEESPYYIVEFCSDHSINVDNVVCNIPAKWYYEMSKSYFAEEGFRKFLKLVRKANAMQRLENYLFPDGLPKINPESYDCTDEEWLACLLKDEA